MCQLQALLYPGFLIMSPPHQSVLLASACLEEWASSSPMADRPSPVPGKMLTGSHSVSSYFSWSLLALSTVPGRALLDPASITCPSPVIVPRRMWPCGWPPCPSQHVGPCDGHPIKPTWMGNERGWKYARQVNYIPALVQSKI